MPRIYVVSRSKRNSYKRMDPEQCTVWPSLGPKSLQKIRKIYSIEVQVQVQSLFRDQTESWIRIVNGIDKFAREAMPIQEEEKASGKPAAKTRPVLKPSSTSGWGFTPVEQRQWIDIGTQESQDPCCFQVSKFINRLLRHSEKVNRQDDGAVHCDQLIDECKKKLSDDARYWSVEMMKQFANAPFWPIDKWISVLAKGGGQKKKVSILLEPELSSEIPVPSCNSKTFKKNNQSCIARQ